MMDGLEQETDGRPSGYSILTAGNKEKKFQNLSVHVEEVHTRAKSYIQTFVYLCRWGVFCCR